MNKNMEKQSAHRDDNPNFKLAKVAFRKKTRVCNQKLPIGFFSESKISVTPSSPPKLMKRKYLQEVTDSTLRISQNSSTTSFRKQTP